MAPHFSRLSRAQWRGTQQLRTLGVGGICLAQMSETQQGEIVPWGATWRWGPEYEQVRKAVPQMKDGAWHWSPGGVRRGSVGWAAHRAMWGACSLRRVSESSPEKGNKPKSRGTLQNNWPVYPRMSRSPTCREQTDHSQRGAELRGRVKKWRDYKVQIGI